jgi:hypothetical protein
MHIRIALVKKVDHLIVFKSHLMIQILVGGNIGTVLDLS